MTYMVMECHLSYAVVLTEDGRFLNVANRHYEVGQTVTDIIELQEPQEKPKQNILRKKWIGSLAAMAACLVLIVTAGIQIQSLTPYGSVYMTINPEVRIDVNRNDAVIHIEGLNQDGKTLIEAYSYKKKDIALVMDELVDLAIEMGYLYEGGQIMVTLDGDSNEWVVNKSDSLESHLNEYLTNKLSVTIEITNNKAGNSGVTIPANPDDNGGDASYGESDYGETTTTPTNPSDSTNPSQSDYADTDYGPNNDGVTDYEDTDYGPNSDGVTDYADTDYGPNNDGVTDYEDTDYGPNNDGVTDYEDTSDSEDSNYGDNEYGDDGDSSDSNYGDTEDSNYGDD